MASWRPQTPPQSLGIGGVFIGGSGGAINADVEVDGCDVAGC
jgi:hypothetical protein